MNNFYAEGKTEPDESDLRLENSHRGELLQNISAKLTMNAFWRANMGFN
jgi:hypothetical protein